MSGLSSQLHNVLKSSINRDADNLCARHHDVAYATLRKVKNAVQHAALIFSDNPRFFTELDN